MIQIKNFKTLLDAAKEESQPQEFLFVFLKVYLADDATPEQAKRFHAGEGGQIMPIMQVHKPLNELSDFSSLVIDAEEFSEEWQIVIIGCLAGRNGEQPEQSEIDRHLETMVNTVKSGQNLSRYVAFNKHGDPIIW